MRAKKKAWNCSCRSLPVRSRFVKWSKPWNDNDSINDVFGLGSSIFLLARSSCVEWSNPWNESDSIKSVFDAGRSNRFEARSKLVRFLNRINAWAGNLLNEGLLLRTRDLILSAFLMNMLAVKVILLNFWKTYSTHKKLDDEEEASPLSVDWFDTCVVNWVRQSLLLWHW